MLLLEDSINHLMNPQDEDEGIGIGLKPMECPVHFKTHCAISVLGLLSRRVRVPCIIIDRSPGTMQEKEIDKVYILPEGSLESTFKADDALPSLPLPSLDATLAKYLQSVKPLVSKEEFATTQKLVDQFRNGVGRSLQELLAEKAAASKNWLEEWWEEHAYLRIRTPLLPFCSMDGPFPLLPEWPVSGPEDQIRNGAMFLYAATYYWRVVREERLRPAQSADKKTTFSMTQYRRLFNGVRVPDEEKDTIVSYFKTAKEGPCPSHVIIFCRGRMFRVNAIDSEGGLLTPPEWATILRQIRELAERLPARERVAVLTCDERTSWCKNRKRLLELSQNNVEAVSAIESAIIHFVLASEAPTTDSQVSSCDLFGGNGERWADKSAIDIAYRNGRLGGISDHSQFDGIASMTLMHFTYLLMQDSKGGWDGRLDVRPEVLRQQEVTVDVDDGIRAEIQRVQNDCFKNSEEVIITRNTFSTFGKNEIKKCDLHPDAFIQMALQLTYAKIHGRPAPCYETATTRGFYNGRTETVRTCTSQCLEWVAVMMDPKQSNEKKKSLLKIAVNEHERLMSEAKDGMGCDRHLFGLYCTAVEKGVPIPEIFNDPSYFKSGGGGNFVLSTSLTGYTPLGGGVAAMVKDGYGAFYCINPTWISVTVSSFRSSTETDAEKFFKTLCDTFVEMRQIYEPMVQSKL